MELTDTLTFTSITGYRKLSPDYYLDFDATELEVALADLGRLPVTPGAEPVIWKEIKANGDYLIIGSEAENHGIQIFDMKKLLDVDPASPKVFDPATEVTSLFNGMSTKLRPAQIRQLT